MEKNILLTIQYDGSAFHGWQAQSGVRTAQGCLEEALGRVLGTTIAVRGTSRTDAGVHALGQRASFITDSGIPTDRIPRAVNGGLTKGRTGMGSQIGDLIVLAAEEREAAFHARFDAVGKTYVYVMDTGKANVFFRNYRYFVSSPLDKDAMGEAASLLVGRHDFRSFKAAGDEAVRTTERTIYRCRIEQRGHLLYLLITGDGFLYNMVRIIAGTLAEVGAGKRKAASIRDILAARDRAAAGHTAPPGGLYLKEIYFSDQELHDAISRRP